MHINDRSMSCGRIFQSFLEGLTFSTEVLLSFLVEEPEDSELVCK